MGTEARDAVPELREALSDDDYALRAAAAKALGSMGTEAGVAVRSSRRLWATVEFPNRGLRKAVCTASWQ